MFGAGNGVEPDEHSGEEAAPPPRAALAARRARATCAPCRRPPR